MWTWNWIFGVITGFGMGTCLGGLLANFMWRRTVRLLNVEFDKMVDLNHLLTNRLFRQGMSEQPWEDMIAKPSGTGPLPSVDAPHLGQ